MAFACRGDMVHASFTIDAPFSGEKETGRLRRRRDSDMKTLPVF